MYLEKFRVILVTKYGYTTPTTTNTNQVTGNDLCVLTHPRTYFLINYYLPDLNLIEILLKEAKLSLDNIAHALDFYWTKIYGKTTISSGQTIEYVNHLPFLFFLLDLSAHEKDCPIVNVKLTDITKDFVYVIKSHPYRIDVEFANEKFISNNVLLYVEYEDNLGETIKYDMCKSINENFSKLVKPKRVLLDGDTILHEDGKITNLSPEQFKSNSTTIKEE